MNSVLVVSVRETGASLEQLEVVEELLRDELMGLDLGPIRRLTAGEARPGVRRGDVAALGGLLVSQPTTQSMVVAVIEVVRGWLGRSRARNRTVHLEIDGDVLELSQVTTGQQSRQIAEWLQRRA